MLSGDGERRWQRLYREVLRGLPGAADRTLPHRAFSWAFVRPRAGDARQPWSGPSRTHAHARRDLRRRRQHRGDARGLAGARVGPPAEGCMGGGRGAVWTQRGLALLVRIRRQRCRRRRDGAAAQRARLLRREPLSPLRERTGAPPSVSATRRRWHAPGGLCGRRLRRAALRRRPTGAGGCLASRRPFLPRGTDSGRSGGRDADRAHSPAA